MPPAREHRLETWACGQRLKTSLTLWQIIRVPTTRRVGVERAGSLRIRGVLAEVAEAARRAYASRRQKNARDLDPVHTVWIDCLSFGEAAERSRERLDPFSAYDRPSIVTVDDMIFCQRLRRVPQRDATRLLGSKWIRDLIWLPANKRPRRATRASIRRGMPALKMPPVRVWRTRSM